MKIELDLNEEQLKQLDHDLVDVLGNLTDDQKVQIMTDVLYKRLEKVDVNVSSRWTTPEESRWSRFINEIIKGLQEKLAESITENMLKNEAIQERAQNAINNTVEHLEEIIFKGIVEFVIKNVFASYKDMHSVENTAYMAMQAANQAQSGR